MSALNAAEPLLSAPGWTARRDALSPAWRRTVVGVVLALHLAAAYGLLQIGAVREAVREAVPIFAGLIAPPPPAPPPPAPPVPRPVLRELPKPVIAAPPAPAAAPPEFVVPPPAPPDAVVSPVAPSAPPAPATAVAAPPRTLLATEVGFLEPLRVTYPPMSRRLREEGRVLLRILVDPQGVPAQVVVTETSGHPRLDEAAAGAARRARLRPYTENGIARTVWVLLPVVFNLEER